jgi:hypothetical protein
MRLRTLEGSLGILSREAERFGTSVCMLLSKRDTSLTSPKDPSTVHIPFCTLNLKYNRNRLEDSGGFATDVSGCFRTLKDVQLHVFVKKRDPRKVL